jgi:hypothetical protein
MTMRPQQTVPAPPSEDVALQFVIDYLTKGNRGEYSNYGYSLHVLNVVIAFLRSHGLIGDVNYGARQVSDPFLSACWHLCRRGILRPTVTHLGAQHVEDGGGYSVTAFGKKWLEEANGAIEYVPVDPGVLAQLLAGYTPKFGSAFHQRAQDAVRCHGAHAYLACCAMCGAGAESILLSLAIKKTGDAEAAAKLYETKNGRSRIESSLIGQQPAHIQNGFRGFIGLLKYWRDDASHGQESLIEEVEAFTSVLLLLRFAQFASDNWDSLTQSAT